MNTTNIEALLNECNYPCVSIILPARELNEMKDVVAEAEAIVRKIELPEETRRRIVKTLLTVSPDAAETGASGLGIFVSPRIAGVLSFPFKVNKEICIDQCFDRELLIQLKDRVLVPV